MNCNSRQLFPTPELAKANTCISDYDELEHVAETHLSTSFTIYYQK